MPFDPGQAIFYQSELSDIWASPDRSAFHVIDTVCGERRHYIIPRALFVAQVDRCIRLLTEAPASPEIARLRPAAPPKAARRRR